MRFEKITIDGQTYYKEIPDEEPATKEEPHAKCGEALGKVWQVLCTIAKKSVCLLDTVWRVLALVGKKNAPTREEARSAPAPEELLSLLPNMDAEGRHRVYLWLLEAPERLANCELATLLPLFCAEERDALYLRFASTLPVEALVACAKLVSAECLHTLVEGYLDGSYRGIEMRSLYPYLSKEDIDRLFEKLSSNA